MFGVENGTEGNENNSDNMINNDDADELDPEMMGQGDPREVMGDGQEDHYAFTEHFDYDIPECAKLKKIRGCTSKC